jgi:hypothetical protein
MGRRRPWLAAAGWYPAAAKPGSQGGGSFLILRLVRDQSTFTFGCGCRVAAEAGIRVRMNQSAGFEAMKVVAEATGVGFWAGARADLAQDEERVGVDGGG